MRTERLQPLKAFESVPIAHRLYKPIQLVIDVVGMKSIAHVICFPILYTKQPSNMFLYFPFELFFCVEYMYNTYVYIFEPPIAL